VAMSARGTISVPASTLGEALPPRRRWADLQDSSQENASCSQPGPPLSQSSYHSPSQDQSANDVVGSGASAVSGTGLPTRLANATSLCSPHESQLSLGASASHEVLPRTENSVDNLENAVDNLAPLSSRLRAWQPSKPVCNSGTAKHGALLCAPPLVRHAASPPRTPARRRRRPELELQNTMQTPLGKRSRGSVRREAMTSSVAAAPSQHVAPSQLFNATVTQPATEATEGDWHRRLEKRRKAVAAIKGAPEYQACAGGRDSGLLDPEDLPLTPEPNDSTLSKRQWEAAVMAWRNLLRKVAWQAGGNEVVEDTV